LVHWLNGSLFHWLTHNETWLSKASVLNELGNHYCKLMVAASVAWLTHNETWLSCMLRHEILGWFEKSYRNDVQRTQFFLLEILIFRVHTMCYTTGNFRNHIRNQFTWKESFLSV